MRSEECWRRVDEWRLSQRQAKMDSTLSSSPSHGTSSASVCNISGEYESRIQEGLRQFDAKLARLKDDLNQLGKVTV